MDLLMDMNVSTKYQMIDVLKLIRISVRMSEFEIQELVAEALNTVGITIEEKKKLNMSIMR